MAKQVAANDKVNITCEKAKLVEILRLINSLKFIVIK